MGLTGFPYRVTINKSPGGSIMSDQMDFESFARYLGFTGPDADMFYEVYHELDCNDEEYELVMEEYWA